MADRQGHGVAVALAAGLIGSLIGGAAVLSVQALRGDSDMPAAVREALVSHPEIIPEALEALEQRRASTAVAQNRAALEAPYHSAWAGAEDGDVVLVEFFDYACSFCRASNPDVERLLEEDPRLKVVWRELPVLGPDSERAAVVSLAAARQGQFQLFHDRLFALGRPSGEAIERARAEVGVTAGEPTPEDRAEIERNYDLARAIGATGTPTFVIGDRVLQGAVGYEALKEAVAAARAG